MHVLAGGAECGGGGGHVDDRAAGAAAAGGHNPGGALCAEQVADDVHVDDTAERLRCHVDERTQWSGDAGVVHQPGDRAELGGGGEDPLDVVLAGDVAGYGHGAAPGRAYHVCGLLRLDGVGAVVDDQVVTCGGEAGGGRGADPPASPGDDRDHAAQVDRVMFLVMADMWPG